MKIGTQLRKLRESRDLTTRGIAEKTDISLSTYLDWEHDKTTPSLRSYIKLAGAFQMCPVELMSYLISQKSKTGNSNISQISIQTGIIDFYKEYNESLKRDKARLEDEVARLHKILRDDV